MRKLAFAAVAVMMLFGITTISADAQPRFQPPTPVASDDAFVFVGPDTAEPAPQIPHDWHVVPMWGDVWANGRAFGTVDFFLFWEAGSKSPRAQLWALWRGQPLQVCVGDIFETPQGEPIFFGKATGGGELAATCHMARTPDFDEISMLIAAEDGQWATAIMTNPNWQRPDAQAVFG
ncbi:MAG: hypothetical protein AAF567_03890 [Actinomycetota bacterium]